MPLGAGEGIRRSPLSDDRPSAESCLFDKVIGFGQTWLKSCWPNIESIWNRSRASAVSRSHLLCVVDAFVNTSGSWPSSPKISFSLESVSLSPSALAPATVVELAPVAAEEVNVCFLLYTDLGTSG